MPGDRYFVYLLYRCVISHTNLTTLFFVANASAWPLTAHITKTVSKLASLCLPRALALRPFLRPSHGFVPHLAQKGRLYIVNMISCLMYYESEFGKKKEKKFSHTTDLKEPYEIILLVHTSAYWSAIVSSCWAVPIPADVCSLAASFLAELSAEKDVEAVSVSLFL